MHPSNWKMELHIHIKTSQKNTKPIFLNNNINSLNTLSLETLNIKPETLNVLELGRLRQMLETDIYEQQDTYLKHDASHNLKL